jgi:hypothetical protein
MFSSNTSSAAGDAVFVEDVFSTTLYTGTGAAQTITNGIDLAGKGGLVWIKNRSTPTNTGDHRLYDTSRGVNQALFSNTTDSSTTLNDSLTAFGSSGFTLGTNARVNEGTVTWASWTFREQPKFFDVVTYTGDGTTPRNIPHNLGSVPGCVIVKMLTDSGYSWQVYHRGLTSAAYRVELDTTGAETTSLNPWVSTAPTDSVFTVSNSLFVNGSGKQYVAYLFAHNAGGFGLTGTDNVISCGSFTTDGSGGATVNHGFADGAQFCIVKASSTTGNWEMFDDKRTPSWSSADARLKANLADAEDTVSRLSGSGTSLSFAGLSGSQTYIYILVASP